MLRKRRAQTALEVVIILSVIVAAFLAARPLIRAAVRLGVTDATVSMTRSTARLP